MNTLQENEQIDIRVKDILGYEYPVLCNKNDTIYEVKQRICDLYDREFFTIPEQIRLIFRGALLEDEKTLTDYHIGDGDTMAWVMKALPTLNLVSEEDGVTKEIVLPISFIRNKFCPVEELKKCCFKALFGPGKINRRHKTGWYNPDRGSFYDADLFIRGKKMESGAPLTQYIYKTNQPYLNWPPVPEEFFLEEEEEGIVLRSNVNEDDYGLRLATLTPGGKVVFHERFQPQKKILQINNTKTQERPVEPVEEEGNNDNNNSIATI